MKLAMKLLETTFAGTLAALAIVCAGTSAHAQSCNFSITSVDFGNIDVTTNGVFTATATYTATCTALVSATRTCPSIGDGTGGSSSGSPRHLVNGGNQLAFNLYSDGGYTTIWGSHFWGNPYTPPPVDISTIIIGNGNASLTVHARIPAGQQTLPAGLYTSSFTGAHTRITYDAYILGLFPPDCATLNNPSGTAPFTVQANIIPACTVSANLLDFSSVGTLSGNIDSTNALSITCTAQTPYSISLNGGLAGATDPTQRKMSKGAETITYGLYRDAARAQPWGSTVGVNTVSATGTGLAQPHTVYGRVPAQATPSPGLYSDTIVVTVSY